jgi:NAD(P)-dependent dehydrogenase (short-subunit alcohol dehydrogenase family)
VSLLLQTPTALVARLVRRVTGSTASPLAGRTVLVTGASSGIGEATAYAAARRGAHVLLVARRLDALEAVAEGIRADGGQAEAYACDLTDGDSVDALVDRVLAEHGAVDYLVNNAGRSIRRSLELTRDRFHDFERTMAVNYFGPVRLTMGLLPAMRQQRFGHVVNVLSWGVQLPAPKFAAYLASKSALDTWSRVAARETYADNVTFTNVRMRNVLTPMLVSEDERDRKIALTPEQAAERIVRALEDRPVHSNEWVGTPGQLFQLAFPRLADRLASGGHRSTPDTAAAAGTGAASSSYDVSR